MFLVGNAFPEMVVWNVVALSITQFYHQLHLMQYS